MELDTLENELLRATLASADVEDAIFVSEDVVAILASEDAIIDDEAIFEDSFEWDTISAVSLFIMSAWAEAAAWNVNVHFFLYMTQILLNAENFNSKIVFMSILLLHYTYKAWLYHIFYRMSNLIS